MPSQDIQAVANDRSKPGNYTGEEVYGEWEDSASNDRAILWEAYIQKELKTPAPVVLYSPWGISNREANAMLGGHFFSHGFVTFHLQHEGGDDKAVRADRKIMRAIDGPERVGIAGHSYVALTAQVVKGYDQKLAVPELLGVFLFSLSPVLKTDIFVKPSMSSEILEMRFQMVGLYFDTIRMKNELERRLAKFVSSANSPGSVNRLKTKIKGGISKWQKQQPERHPLGYYLSVPKRLRT
ncbi:MAG: hypothetical protein ACUVWO_18075 [Thermodesulfobacteriota bacterium]